MPTEPSAYLSNQTLLYLVPELLLLAVAVFIYVGGAFWRWGSVWNWIAAGGVLAAGLALATSQPTALELGPVASDALAWYVRWLVLVVGLLFVMLTSRAVDVDFAAEYVATILITVIGLMLVAAARDLVLIFVGLELVSIPTYILLYLGRHDLRSQESAAKYFFLSVISSALMLYGFSFLYGVGGSTRLVEIAQGLADAAARGEGLVLFGSLGLILTFAGLAFRIAAVPFHFYAPDVYQGTTNGNAGLLSVVPKIAGMVVLVRVAGTTMPGIAELGWQLALVLAAMTMTLGNVVALWQTNLRRLFAYSSIAHAGYMLIGLAVGFAAGRASDFDPKMDGLGATLFYLAVYALATTGAFAALCYLSQAEGDVEDLEDLAGAGRTHPTAGIALAVFMFSLAGIPPLAGFWGKLAVFSGALTVNAAPGEGPLQVWFVGMAVLGVLNAAIAAGYYLRVVAMLYFREPRARLAGQGGAGAWGAMVVCMLLVVAVGVVFPGEISRSSLEAGQAAVVQVTTEPEPPADYQASVQEVAAEWAPAGR